MSKDWWKKSVVYQIYPRSFKDGNGDGIGDIKGIIDKLEYINQLGADVIWLSPIYSSPNDDNGYDISDYRNIMSEFGSMKDFDVMLEKAHALGIKIVMDLVVNHTSDEHEWFMRSRRGDEEYKDYYIWRKGKGGFAPTNWGAWFGGSAWEYDESRKEYYLHCFSKKQPDLNWENEKVRNEVYDMMKFWCDKGIDGFRMDVISLISKTEPFKDTELKANGFGDLSNYVCSGPRVHEFLKEMNKEVLSKYNLLTVGECPGVTTNDACRYAGKDENELSMVFQFEHMDLDGGESFKWNDRKIDLVKLKEVLSRWQYDLYDKAWNSLYFCNHDQPRIVSRLGDDKKYREESAKTIATCLHFMQGTPYIYQGEELGMTNVDFSDINEFRDIESLNAYKEFALTSKIEAGKMLDYIRYKSRDNARTPMQWTDEEYAGFSKVEPWIRVNSNYKEINVQEQICREDSVLNYYKKLIKLRKEEDIITYGKYKLLFENDSNLYIYQRLYNDDVLLIVCNFSGSVVEFESSNCGYGDDFNILINNYKQRNTDKGINEIKGKIIKLMPFESFVIKYKK